MDWEGWRLRATILVICRLIQIRLWHTSKYFDRNCMFGSRLMSILELNEKAGAIAFGAKVIL
ncbi:hypothetical protein NYA10_30215, partial [Burkholderia thailandensis]|nr:hypothetical protein [Burkholderia thailandensis]